MKIILILTLILFLIVSCNKKFDEIIEIDGKLLLVEDLDGEGGILDGDFGDIVVFDIDSVKRYEITDDDYYDRYPTYSKTMNSIVFEAKKIGVHSITGLTSDSNIFSLNLKTKVIEQIDNKLIKRDSRI
jgi:hypothetical protein